ncbi:halocyanin domain-containing protein [Haloarcula litorea]|uniref:halocyanin domain-containing protein n=1 Tax=Haloarcula litorea TaxID=3032579 RepID=UPI0023E7BF7B|nr:halocyanin domain-containing protein [Halomicroarcula sp. GDY20]
MTRRQFARATTTAVALGATATASAQQGVDYGEWFENVSNFDGTVDRTGQDTVEIAVGAEGNNGAFAFGPAAVRVSPGTEVVWTWTGDGGGHNVVSNGDGPLDSGSPVSDEGTTYSYTFEDEGVYKYVCTPHKALGMKGAVVVGDAGGGASGGSGGTETAAPTSTATETSASANATGDDRAGGGDDTVLLSLAAVITMAFLSPVAFAAFIRRKTGG